jgi:hypothetical protein
MVVGTASPLQPAWPSDGSQLRDCMTQRERHTPEGGALPVADNGVSCLCANLPGESAAASLWEEWYRRASPAQQQDLLAIARQQGVVYSPQLTAVPEAPPPRPLVPSLLNGHLHDLAPHHPPAIEVVDRELDAAQREAVARAVTTPDLCLIEGYPGTGKSRVLAEVVRQMTGRGQRVLLLAPTTAAIDCVLERLACGQGILAVRHLNRDEKPEALAPCVRRQTVAERLRSLRDETLPAAREAAAQAAAARNRRQAQQPLWGRLEELAAHADAFAQRQKQLDYQQATLPTTIDSELAAANTAVPPSPFQAAWLESCRSHDTAAGQLAERAGQLHSQAEQTRADLARIDKEREQLAPVVAAVRSCRLWSPDFWRGAFRSGLGPHLEELERAHQERTAALGKLEQDHRDLDAERCRLDAQAEAARAAFAETEVCRRREQLDAEAASIAAELRLLDEAWTVAGADLGAEAPAEKTLSAVHAARQRWEQALQQDQHHEAFARKWVEAIEEAVPTFPGYLTRSAGVLAATTATLASDPAFTDPASPLAFDLLVLDEAQLVTESEFQAAARRCQRWLLMGEAPVGGHEPPRQADRSATMKPTYFQRLWQHLHADPRRLGYSWARAGDHLVCSLRPVPPGQEQWLETEPVADRPDVELRILTPPRPARSGPRPPTPVEPQLAQVVFPASNSLADAKTFLYRELQELTVQARGPTVHWEQHAGAIVLRLGPTGTTADRTQLVPLGDGISERLEAGTWYTLALEFDAASWTRERAEDWVADHLRLRDVGRTAVLAGSHRAGPALTTFLSDLLFSGGCTPAGHTGFFVSPEPPVEFVAVPPWHEGHRREHDRPRETVRGAAEFGGDRAAVSVRAPRSRSARGGAGLELDLSDSRPIEHLPADLRALLPRQGMVNYLEARAVVARLEALLADPSFVAAAVRWQQERSALCQRPNTGCVLQPGAGHGVHAPAIAVMALYPAQADLIRHLFRRSTASSTPVSIEFGVPGVFHGRECLAALVSLTRSHVHRAVPFGEGPQALAEAVTRPAGRLILFGDPATLARRSQWQGAVDHLDEPTARVERRLVAHLVSYLQGHGAHPTTFRMVESTGA